MSEARRWLIYGANGYTGTLIAREAVARGHRPILAGRNRAAVEALARRLGLESAVFDIGEETAGALRNVEAVLHCAGPFHRTSGPMVRACLQTGTHYLDITGEIAVFESIFKLDGKAKEAGVALIPGVGFDVVPTDCLAAMLAAALPDATDLSLAFYSKGGRISPGTMKTMIEGMPHGGAIRRDGRIVRVGVAHDAREIPFGCGTRWAMTIPWGDVSTAFRTTGIANIRVYSAAPLRTIRRLQRFGALTTLLRFTPLRRLLQSIAARRTGLTDAARARARTFLWGEATSAKGESVSRTMETPDGYSLTALTAVRSVERVLSGQVTPGSWTPARAFGAAFIEEIPGVVTQAPQKIRASNATG